MPYTTPSTITTGQLVTASLMNSEWGGNITFLANPPACRVRRTTNQSINSGAETAITFDAERYDTNTMHSTVTNTSRVTFTTAGLYIVTGHARFAANGTGIRQVGIRLGGSTYIAVDLRTNPGGGVVAPMSIATTYKFAVAEYVELVAYQDSGGALNVETVGNMSAELSAAWIGLG